MLGYSEDNTDDEQEDLPYDGDLQNTYQSICDSENLEDITSVENAPQGLFTMTSQICNHSKEKLDCKTQLSQKKINLTSLTREFTITTEKELPSGDFRNSGSNQHFSCSKMSDVLLRHFPKEFSTSCQLIDSETIPDISFTESFNETILNKIKNSESARTSLPKEEGTNTLECYNSEREGKCESIESFDLIDGDQFGTDGKTNLSYDRKKYKADNQQFVTQKEEDAHDEELNYFSNPKETYGEQKCFLEMTSSSNQLKYGQHQVHYRLPDFSKIAPKVKIPKGNNSKSASVIKKTKSSPNLLGKSAIIEDVLEAMNVESVAMKNQEEEIRISELDQQLELLTKQAEAQNHIDHLRFNTKLLPCSNSCSPNTCIKTRGPGVTSDISTVPPITVPVKSMLSFLQSPCSELQAQRMVSSLTSAGAANQASVNPPPLQRATEGENISQMLKEQTEGLKTKVENFSKYMTQDMFPIHECHQLVERFKEQLGQLELNYLAMKEKHCALQLQSYKHPSTSIGEFDPDRKLEGEIFKLEMLLEDIKEKIDKGCNSHSLSLVSSLSLTPCESVNSSCPESPMISSISEPPPKIATEVNIFNHEKYGQARNPMEIIPQKKSQQSSYGGKCHLFHQENFNYWAMRSPPPANPDNTGNQKSSTADLSVLKEQRGTAYSADPYFLEQLGNPTKEHNIVIHPRLKIQLSSKRICPCSSSRTKNIEHRKANREKSDCERFSIVLEEKAVDLSDSDTEDISFCDLMGNSSNKVFLEQKTRSHGSRRVGPKEQSKVLPHRDWKTHFYMDSQRNDDIKGCYETELASPQKKSITHQPSEQWTDRLSERQNLHIPQTHYSRMHNAVIFSPQYLTSRNTHGRKSISNLTDTHTTATDKKILNSTLDLIIQTANNLKKTTEHMIKVVSKDLAKAKTQTFSNTAASQY
ncbi:protein AKNAD1 [Hemicordylus capensis]|uniref:protein AKNAD1 n=1 Tax=Hemicordylus capensis TaxID=884348 RepID=UPI0023030A27|nr:protein AKNAD1 [Hemicordylus capensis]XP_053106315.1 protein AKNAD1 [Hemicordylus capensis]XP_053106316.1 protein AKNAD1 [Hemicordylus capensis]XP_053106317.1 protein AKNAD1 [Hemicordylus capensis]XP_053106318.1 protein AKNAD1 [Hemicordylus capensis]XP_053106319.1 protein AKNAD1 [Hemicordylus capensis]